MSKQRHDNGWQKANREGAPIRGRAAADRRKAAKAARAAALLARAEAATLAGERDEEFHIRERERAAEQPSTPEPTPAPQPAPTPATTAPVRPCAHCGEQFPVKGSKRYCSGDCRHAARHVAPPAKGSMRDRPHRTLLGSK